MDGSDPPVLPPGSAMRGRLMCTRLAIAWEGRSRPIDPWGMARKKTHRGERRVRLDAPRPESAKIAPEPESPPLGRVRTPRQDPGETTTVASLGASACMKGSGARWRSPTSLKKAEE